MEHTDWSRVKWISIWIQCMEPHGTRWTGNLVVWSNFLCSLLELPSFTEFFFRVLATGCPVSLSLFCWFGLRCSFVFLFSFFLSCLCLRWFVLWSLVFRNWGAFLLFFFRVIGPAGFLRPPLDPTGNDGPRFTGFFFTEFLNSQRFPVHFDWKNDSSSVTGFLPSFPVSWLGNIKVDSFQRSG